MGSKEFPEALWEKAGSVAWEHSGWASGLRWTSTWLPLTSLGMGGSVVRSLCGTRRSSSFLPKPHLGFPPRGSE